MGRGDKRTRRGKITLGTFGKMRPARMAKKTTTAATAVVAEEKKD
jgi:30S ribosomal protein S31